MTAPIAHPWTIPRDDDDDGPPDVGDPRDMTPQTIARGGMTVVDREAWLASINEACARTEDAPLGRSVSVDRLRGADQDGALAEYAIAQGRDPERAFALAGLAIATPEDAAILRDHWVYGPRFWAWWQGRQKAEASEPQRTTKGHEAGTIRPYSTAAHLMKEAKIAGYPLTPESARSIVSNADPRPVLTLANGEAVRADRLYTKNARGEWYQCPRLAIVDGVQWQEALGGWERSGGRRWPDDLVEHGYDRVYPPEVPIQGLTPKPTPSTNAHGIDASAIRAGDYVRKREGQWAQVARPWARGSLHARLDSGAGIHTYFNHPDDVFEHRPAPRIVLPDGREVVPERMWRRGHDGDYADIDGSAWTAADDGEWIELSPGVPWFFRTVAVGKRLWPPLDVVPA